MFKDDLWGQGSIANNDIISDKSDMTNTGQKQHQSNVNQHKQQHEQQNNAQKSLKGFSNLYNTDEAVVTM